MKKSISSVIFWGSLWGLSEATIGYVLHMIPVNMPGITGFLMFPLAYYFMYKTYRQTGKAQSILYVSLVASAIKLIDFLIPLYMPIRILYPAWSIILEGAVVFAGYKITERKRAELNFAEVWSVSVIWRLLFAPSWLLLPPEMIKTSSIGGLLPFLSFALVESTVNSMIIYGYLSINKKFDRKDILNKAAFQPVFSILLLVLAIISHWILS